MFFLTLADGGRPSRSAAAKANNQLQRIYRDGSEAGSSDDADNEGVPVVVPA